MKASSLFLSLAVTLLVLGCTERPPSAPGPSVQLAPDGGLPPELAALVNGRPVTHFEVVLRLRAMQGATPEQAIEALVVDELRAQRARELGLEKDPAFLQELARLEAQVAEVKRRELSKLFVHREVLEKAEPTDEEVKAYLERHRARFASRVTVRQLLRRDRAALEEAKGELGRGARFQDLVLRSAGETPLTLADVTVGPLRWDQVPSAWWSALDALEPGQVSDVIAQPGGAFALLELVAREPTEAPPGEQLSALVRTVLKAERLEALRERTDAALQQGARVTRGAPPQRP